MGISARWKIAALVWGFAEATLFFIVPDVLLTLAAIRLGWRKAFYLLFLTLIGALLGGAVMFGFALWSWDAAYRAVDWVPLVSPNMIERVGGEMQTSWLWQMTIGAMTGTPYKVFAISAPGAGISLWAFVLGSVFARIIRWVLVIGLAKLVVSALKRAGLTRMAMPVWAATWGLFYAFFTAVMES